MSQHSMSMGHYHSVPMPMHALNGNMSNMAMGHGMGMGMGMYRPHDIDDEKSMTYTSPTSPALPPLPALPAPRSGPKEKEATEPCRLRFERWLCDTVKLGQYLHLFRASECDDVRMIEFFEEDALEKEIGVARTFHRKLILKKATEFKAAQSALSRALEADAPEAKALCKHKDALEEHGIVSLRDLADLFEEAKPQTVLGESVDAKMVQAMARYVRGQV